MVVAVVVLFIFSVVVVGGILLQEYLRPPIKNYTRIPRREARGSGDGSTEFRGEPVEANVAYPTSILDRP